MTTNKPPALKEDILELIGNTPLVKLNKIPQRWELKPRSMPKLNYSMPEDQLKIELPKIWYWKPKNKVKSNQAIL